MSPSARPPIAADGRTTIGPLAMLVLLSMASPVGSVDVLVGVPLLGALVLVPIAVVVYLWRSAFRTS